MISRTTTDVSKSVMFGVRQTVTLYKETTIHIHSIISCILMNDLPYLMAAWIAEMEIRFPANKDPKVVTRLLETITIYRKGLFY